MLSCLRSRSPGPASSSGAGCAHPTSRSRRPTFCPARSPDRAGRSRCTHAGWEIVRGDPHSSAGQIRRGGARPSDSPATSGCRPAQEQSAAEEICTRSGTKAAATTSNRAPGTEWYLSRYRTTASEPDTASPGRPLTTPTRGIDPAIRSKTTPAAGAIHDDTRDHLPAVVPTLDELTDLGDPCLSWVRTLSRTPARTCPAARHGARLSQPRIPTSR